jgi:predicted metal-dependent phosphoesterase TrpH
MTASQPRIDLHTHSTASDGTLSPSEVIQLALQHRLTILALTDHDTSDGLAEAQAAAQDTPLTVIPGIELTTSQPDGEAIDVLGYLYDPAHPAMQSKLATIRERRRTRAAEMVERLHALGLSISLERVYALAGDGTVGRPHVAQALLEAGSVASRQDAFDRYIGDDGPASVPHYRLTMQEGIDMLHAAGGVAVLAHPIRVKDYAARIGDWVALGLDGLEVYYPDHNNGFTKQARVIARRYDLVMTGGSDFHRTSDGRIKLGTMPVPPDCVDQLRARAAQYR